MKGDIVRKILPVLDDLERSLAHRPEGDSWADGMELIARKFQQCAGSRGRKAHRCQRPAIRPELSRSDFKRAK